MFSSLRLIRLKQTWRSDCIAGLIVAIVALPLAIGFSIASGVPPAMGVYTAIIGGFFSALFGGSEFQISGPTGAMVVVILSSVQKYGIEGLLLATVIAGILLILIGLLGFGKIIEYVPSPVIVGFTAGIACIILFGQVNNVFGIAPIYPPDATFLTKTITSFVFIPELNWAAVSLAILTFFCLVVTPRISKKIPGSIIAVIITTLLVWIFPTFLAVNTVSTIGSIPQNLPIPTLPLFTFSTLIHVFPAAVTIAVLAAIESLLSAVVADSLTDTKHNPNRELMGQGIGNILSGLFGGIPSTGAIARTATNIRNGGKSRLSGMLHAIILLIFVLVAAPVASMIPLPTLGGILMFVAYNMVEWDRMWLIMKTPLSDVIVMITTFLITILVDLTAAIEIGLVLASILFMKRISDLYAVEAEDDTIGIGGSSSLVRRFNHPDISIYTVSGPLFFGAASRFDQAVAMTPGGRKPIKIIRMKHVPVIDATGLNFMQSTFKKHRRMGGIVLFTSVHPDVLRILRRSGIEKEIGPQHFFPSTKLALVHALRHAHRLHGIDEVVLTEELNQYNLTEFENEELTNSPETKDQDPIAEVLDSVGITRLSDMGHIISDPIKSVLRSLGIEHIPFTRHVKK